MQKALEELRQPERISEAGVQAVDLDGDDEPQSEDDEATNNALEKLRSLEAEKQHFEEMLQSSQAEHESLLGRLNEMRALMSALGVKDEPDSEAEVDDEQR